MHKNFGPLKTGGPVRAHRLHSHRSGPAYVETVSFSVRVNGVFSESLKPSKGIRQGDPYPLTYFCYAMRVYPVYWPMKKALEELKV